MKTKLTLIIITTIVIALPCILMGLHMHVQNPAIFMLSFMFAAYAPIFMAASDEKTYINYSKTKKIQVSVSKREWAITDESLLLKHLKAHSRYYPQWPDFATSMLQLIKEDIEESNNTQIPPHYRWVYHSQQKNFISEYCHAAVVETQTVTETFRKVVAAGLQPYAWLNAIAIICVVVGIL
jgi:hypothetical protein